MVKYAIATLQAMVSTKLTSPIKNIHERPTFNNLWHLQRQLVEGLCKLVSVKLTLDGHVIYILSKDAFTLFSSKEWRDPEEVGEYCKTPTITITETEQQTEKNR